MAQMIGPYEVQSVLGQGGMAIVYKAYHPALDRTVAIKLMLQGLGADPSFLARFQREARAAARMQHPNIVAVYDYGEQNGKPYLVMEYIDGGSLADLLKRGPLPIERAVWIVSQIADALHYAHQQGLVHRDVKPANILLSRDGRRAVLSDFGIVKPVEATGGSGLTQVGMAVGTPEYMSPEQALAEPLDGRSDLFSLGVVLYHTLVGRPPFSGASPTAVVSALLTQNPVPPRLVDPRIPVALEAVVLKALARDRALRYQTGEEFKQALQGALAGGGVTVVGGGAGPTVGVPGGGYGPPVTRPGVPAGGAGASPPYGVPAGGAVGSPPYGVPAGGAGASPPYGVPAGGAGASPPYGVPAGGAGGSPPYGVPPAPRPPSGGRRGLSVGVLAGVIGAVGVLAVCLVVGVVALVVANAGTSSEPTATVVVVVPSPPTRLSPTASVAVPSPRATVAPTPAVKYIINENFADNRNNWNINNIDSAIDPGRLRFKSNNPGRVNQVWPRGLIASDLIIEADLQKLSGPPDIGYGIFFRESEIGDYAFLINDLNEFRLVRYVEAAKDYDRMIRASAPFNFGGAKVTIRAVIKGNNFRFEINGRPVIDNIQETKAFSTTGTFGVWVDGQAEIACTRFVAIEN